MAKRVEIGDLTERVEFQSRGLVDDGFGKLVPGGDFQPQFTESACLTALRGTEPVIAARLQGRQPFVVTVYRNSRTREVGPDWQIVDVHNRKRVFAIKAPATDPDGSRMWLDFLCELGGQS